MKKTLFLTLFLSIFLLVFTSNVTAANHNSSNSQQLQCPVQPDHFYTHPKTNTIWKVLSSKNTCTKRPVQSAKVYFTYKNSWDPVNTVAASKIQKIKKDEAGFLPWGPKYNPKGGALVKIPSDNRVYLLLDGKKYWIKKPKIFNALSYKWGWIQDVSPKLLKNYETEGEIDYTDRHPAGTLIKYPDSNKVYKLEKKQDKLVKRHIKDPKVFKKLGYRFDRVVTIGKQEQYNTDNPITLQEVSKKEKSVQTQKEIPDQEGSQEIEKVSKAANLYPAIKNDKWGYINKQGSWKIKPQFNYAKPFFEGRAAVNVAASTSFEDKDSKWGIINKQGEFVVEPKYPPSSVFTTAPKSPIGHYSQGLVPVNPSKGFGSTQEGTAFYLDRQGNKKLSGKFKQVGQFSDGLAPVVNKEDKVGYINQKGEKVIEPKFGEGLLYSGGLIPIQPANKDFGGWKFINKQGQVKIKGPFREAHSFYNGLAGVDGKYINPQGKTVFDVESFVGTPSFKDDRAIVSKSITDFKSKKVIVNKKGETVYDLSQLEADVCSAEAFHKGLAQIILSSTGVCSASHSSPTNGGMADVNTRPTSSYYAYIDKKGDIIYKARRRPTKAMNSLTIKQRQEVKQLFSSSKEVFESRKWKQFLKKHTKAGRVDLLNKYYNSLYFAIAFAAPDSSIESKIKQKWKKLLRDFGFDKISKDRETPIPNKNKKAIKEKLSKMSFEEQKEFFSRLMGLFGNLDKDKKPNFGKLIDMKVKGNKGAVLIERKEEKAGEIEVKQVSKGIAKKGGNWKWIDGWNP